MFTDIALLVEIQGELMNNIEKNVMGATDYVSNSKTETEKAIAYKKFLKKSIIIYRIKCKK
uniref:t-SNARE coiled-coil homology domain-containing protein n=1 Tax=Neogobius melanostomus TaxID=47308 RepID=A0A8C6V9K5_9GOBI